MEDFENIYGESKYLVDFQQKVFYNNINDIFIDKNQHFLVQYMKLMKYTETSSVKNGKENKRKY